MKKVSGLTKHQSTSEKPLKYSHLDVAGSSGGLPDPTTGSSVVALAMHFLQWFKETPHFLFHLKPESNKYLGN